MCHSSRKITCIASAGQAELQPPVMPTRSCRPTKSPWCAPSSACSASKFHESPFQATISEQRLRSRFRSHPNRSRWISRHRLRSMAKATQSRHKNGIDGIVPSHGDAEVRGTVPNTRRRIGHPHTTRGEPNPMLCSDLTLSKRVDSYSYVHRLSHGVDLDRRLAGSGNRDVSGGREKGLDLDHGAANTHSVEQFAGPWH